MAAFAFDQRDEAAALMELIFDGQQRELRLDGLDPGGFSWQQASVFAIAIELTACASLPEISRTRAVRDVKLEMQISPDDLTVAAGDEVRWVSLRKEWILVQVPRLDADDLTCQSGFSDWRGRMQESVKVGPNGTVSLCFKDKAEVLDNVRAQTAVGGGDLVFSGIVRVEVADEM